MDEMVIMLVYGIIIGFLMATMRWYPYKYKADMLSKHAETLQYCLDMCADCVEELQSSVTSPKKEVE